MAGLQITRDKTGLKVTDNVPVSDYASVLSLKAYAYLL